MALQPLRLNTATSPIAVTLLSRMVSPSLPGLGVRLAPASTTRFTPWCRSPWTDPARETGLSERGSPRVPEVREATPALVQEVRGIELAELETPLDDGRDLALVAEHSASPFSLRSRRDHIATARRSCDVLR